MGGVVAAFVMGLGVGYGHDQPPGLVDARPQLAGHIEGTLTPAPPISIGLSVPLAAGSYKNTVPPPALTIDADDRIDFRRVGIGMIVEAHVPVTCDVQLSAGAGGYLYRSEATATALIDVFRIPTDYYNSADRSVGGELRAGADLRVAARALLGVRAGWTWYEAHFETTGGGQLGGPWLEFRVALESRAL